MAPPRARARPVLGLDLTIVPGAVGTLRAAGASGRILAAPRVAKLAGGAGLLLLAPVYRAGAAPRITAGRIAALQGLPGARAILPDAPATRVGAT